MSSSASAQPVGYGTAVMLESYFGMRQLPFGRSLAPSDLFHSTEFDELQARLSFAVYQRGFALVSGEIGAGKSTALRSFASTLDPMRHPLVYIADSALRPREFYRLVLEHLGVTPAHAQSGARKQFEAAMLDLSQHQGKNPVLIIDEGQELSALMLQELRYILNLGFDAPDCFTLILCGQPELRGMLRLKAFEAVAQRVSVRFHLHGLTSEEVPSYLNHHLRVVGAPKPLFTEAAIDLLRSHSRCLPRPLGYLALQALLDTAHNRRDFVEDTSVRRAIAELDNA